MAEQYGAGVPLLSTREVAAFVTHGYLRFDELVPPELCKAALAELTAGFHRTPLGAPSDAPETAWMGRGLDELWRDSRGIGPVLRLPRLQGIIHSLVGPRARYDHHYAHVIPPRQRWSQPWHADAILDPRVDAFDIQMFFFFHDTPREAGGTMFLPGSHLRRVNEADIARYQNFRGQVPTVCRAGTVLVAHHGIWHCGQPNHTDQPRTMFKLRLGPGKRQRLTWDTGDLTHPAVAEALRHTHPWTGGDARLEIVNRVRLWRHLVGQPTFDVDYWLTRIENPA